VRVVESVGGWMRAYPDDEKAVSNLGSLYGDVCRYEEAIAQFEKARAMNPHNYIFHENLMEMFMATSDFDRARVAYKEMQRNGLDDDSPHLYLYAIASLQNAPSQMDQQGRWGDHEPQIEHEILSEQQ